VRERFIALARDALLLKESAWRELRDSPALTPAALLVATIAILLGGFGAYLWAVVADVQTIPDISPGKGDFLVDAFILGSIMVALLWLGGVVAAYVVLTQVYRETVAGDALLRIAAVGAAPFALGLLVCIPGIGYGIGLMSIALMFFVTVFGVRAAYPAIDPLRVVVALLAGFAVWTMVLPLLSDTGNPFTPGAFVFEWSEDMIEESFASLGEGL
jgi:hypothetical protein